jgi:2,3-bisphosphoglycerate-independent phosphoglycerate mutase
MKNLSLRMKVLSGVLCAGLTFSGTNISFAAVKQEGNAPVKFVTSMNAAVPMDKVEDSAQPKRNDIFEALIKESVDSKDITRDEGEKVLKYVAEKVEKKCGDNEKCKKERGDHGKKGGLFNELVTEGILTKEKSEVLREKMHAKGAKIKTEELQKGLTTLVDNKVLTMEQRGKVEEAIMAKHAQRKEEFNKMKTMNEKEREEHMKKMRDTESDPMKELVEKGTITKAQMKEINKVLHHHHNHDEHK